MLNFTHTCTPPDELLHHIVTNSPPCARNPTDKGHSIAQSAVRYPLDLPLDAPRDADVAPSRCRLSPPSRRFARALATGARSLPQPLSAPERDHPLPHWRHVARPSLSPSDALPPSSHGSRRSAPRSGPRTAAPVCSRSRTRTRPPEAAASRSLARSPRGPAHLRATRA